MSLSRVKVLLNLGNEWPNPWKEGQELDVPGECDETLAHRMIARGVAVAVDGDSQGQVDRSKLDSQQRQMGVEQGQQVNQDRRRGAGLKAPRNTDVEQSDAAVNQPAADGGKTLTDEQQRAENEKRAQENMQNAQREAQQRQTQQAQQAQQAQQKK